MKSTRHFPLTLAAAASLLFSVGAIAQAGTTGSGTGMGNTNAPLTKEQYKSEKEKIDAAYDSAKASCDPMTGNAKDSCMAQAKAKQKTDKAALEARYKGTEKAQMDARETKADEDYSVAKEKCKAMSGSAKDSCMQQAESAHDKAKAAAQGKAAKKPMSGE